MNECPPNTPSDHPEAGWWVDSTDNTTPSPPLSTELPRPEILAERDNVTDIELPNWDPRPEVTPFEPVPLAPPEGDPSAVSPFDSVRPNADLPATPPASRRRIGKVLIGTAGAVALVAGGVFAGTQLVDSDPVVVADPVAVSVQEPSTSVADAPAPPQVVEPLPVAPGPVAEDAVEPVAAVASAVAPAVVRIDTGAGTGSGIIYDESGLIVTNAHVVGTATEVIVHLADGTRTPGTVLGTAPNVDVAVVQIDGSLDFAVAVLAATSTVEVGQLAVAVGSPFGLDQTVTAGIISAINRAVPSTNVIDGSQTVVEMIQTDAPINPGNSGGALADRQGRVVGMNTSIRTDGTVQGNLGVGFAIPSDTVALVASRIVNGESLESGFLGIRGQDPVTGAPGALITDVVADSPAEAAGLQAGDLIVAIDGIELPGMTELGARIRLSTPGTPVALEILRDGQSVQLEVTLGTFEQ